MLKVSEYTLILKPLMASKISWYQLFEKNLDFGFLTKPKQHYTKSLLIPNLQSVIVKKIINSFFPLVLKNICSTKLTVEYDVQLPEQIYEHGPT